MLIVENSDVESRINRSPKPAEEDADEDSNADAESNGDSNTETVPNSGAEIGSPRSFEMLNDVPDEDAKPDF